MIAILGIILLLAIAFLLSNNKSGINKRTVIGAFLVQALLAMFILYVPIGRAILSSIANGISSAIDAGKVGVEFIFGGLAQGNVGFIFGIHVLSLIIFFSSLISVLYYLRIMPLLINSIGFVIHKMLGTSRSESLAAAANIFVGHTEAPLTVKPFIGKMTESELFTVMVVGLASVAGSVIAGYAVLGIDMKYLVSAAFMAAPGGILMSKLMLPERNIPIQTMDELQHKTKDLEKPENIIEAAAFGATTGLKLALNVGAMLIAFIGLIALINIILGGTAGLVGFEGLSLEYILGLIFSPIAYLIGVPWEEASVAGSYIGQKLVTNEFVAYINFVKDMSTLSEHTKIIIVFALCGFANLSSVGILIGGLGVISPNRKKDIARLGFKAVLAGTLSNLMSAALAGIFTSIA